MTETSGQFKISEQCQDNFAISGISELLIYDTNQTHFHILIVIFEF